MIKTRFINNEFLKADLEKLIKDYVINSDNLPDQFSSIDTFKKHISENAGIVETLSRTVNDYYIQLDLGDDVMMYDRRYRVISKSYNIETQTMIYHIR